MTFEMNYLPKANFLFVGGFRIPVFPRTSTIICKKEELLLSCILRAFSALKIYEFVSREKDHFKNHNTEFLKLLFN